MLFRFVTVVLFTVASLAAIACGSPGEADPSSFSSTSTQQTLPAFGDIDESVKDNVGVMAPRPTDEEIGIACQALHDAGWNYTSLGMGASGRSMMIAASITTFASGEQLVGYCESKMNPDQVLRYSSAGCDDLIGSFVGAILELAPHITRAELDTFQHNGVGSVTKTTDMQMDVLLLDSSGQEQEAVASGQLNIETCIWNYRSVMSKPSN